jgi:predicted nucleotidyltransferase component of viral defense system
MRFSGELLNREAGVTGFRPEILEKVFQLLHLLKSLLSHPYLRERIVLKGGTALNLFYFNVPRLSVDIDLNYIGAVDRAVMMQERPEVERAVQAVCSREDFTIRRQPSDHAGGKWSLRYESGLGAGGNLEVDLNFMFREPLFSFDVLDSKQVGSFQTRAVPVIDIHELAAGKLAALFSRQASRDLYDAHLMLRQWDFNNEMLRLAFVVYGAMNRKDWRTVSLTDVTYDWQELENQLVPVLSESLVENINLQEWTETLVEECRQLLSNTLLPLKDNEIEFLTMLNDSGEIWPDLLTGDEGLQATISVHPLLKWKAQNVRQHRRRMEE